MIHATLDSGDQKYKHTEEPHCTEVNKLHIMANVLAQKIVTVFNLYSYTVTKNYRYIDINRSDIRRHVSSLVGSACAVVTRSDTGGTISRRRRTVCR